MSERAKAGLAAALGLVIAVVLVAGAVVGLVSSCGGGDSSSGSPDADVPDAHVACDVVITVSPTNPAAPVELVATANVTGVDGVLSYSWGATGPSGGLPTTERAPDGSEVGVTAAAAGPYTITVTVDDDDGSCNDSVTVNVLPVGAAMRQIALRFAPPDDGTTPPQQQGVPFTVYEDTDWNVGTVTLIGGKTIDGFIVGPDGPVSAYLRVAAVDFTAEAFSSDSGDYQLRVLDRAPELFDVTIVPYAPTVAPDRQMLAASDLDTALALDRGDLVDGVVVDSTGAAVPSATVAVATGNLPASVVTTDVAGHFSAPVRSAAGALSISVVPADGSPLPRLELGEAAGVMAPAPGDLVTVTLAAVPLASVGAVATISSGAPLAAARVVYVATAPATGGSVQIGAAAPVDAPFAARVLVVADDTGVVPAVALPFGLYDVVVDVPASGFDGEGTGLAMLDLTAGPPATQPIWATAHKQPMLVHVADTSGNLAGVRVTAIAQGLHGVGAGVTTTAVSDAVGDAFVDVVQGMPYELIADPPRGVALARARASGTGGALRIDIALGSAITIRGTVVAPPSGLGLAGVRVEAVCSPCSPGESADKPLGETSTETGGSFVLTVPSP